MLCIIALARRFDAECCVSTIYLIFCYSVVARSVKLRKRNSIRSYLDNAAVRFLKLCLRDVMVCIIVSVTALRFAYICFARRMIAFANSSVFTG